MSNKKAFPASFTLERVYPASVDRVYAAWARPEAKARWFSGPPEQWKELERKQDFRVGGEEVVAGRFASGVVSRFVARYHQIIDNERIVLCYDMFVDDKHLSVSIAMVTVEPAHGATRLTYLEHGVFFDDPNGPASREQGTAVLLDRIGETLK